MPGLVRTARGEMIDMMRLFRDNEDSIAITGGGVSMNARGDLLGPGGKIIKTREDFEKDIAAAYNENNPKATKKISVKNPNIIPGLSTEIPKEEQGEVASEMKETTHDAFIKANVNPGAKEATPQAVEVEPFLTSSVDEDEERTMVSLEDAANLARKDMMKQRKKRKTTSSKL